MSKNDRKMSKNSTCDVDSDIIINGKQFCPTTELKRRFLSNDSCASRSGTTNETRGITTGTSTNTIMESSDAKKIIRKRYSGQEKRLKERNPVPGFSKRATSSRGFVQTVHECAKRAYSRMPCWNIGLNRPSPYIAQNPDKSADKRRKIKKNNCKQTDMNTHCSKRCCLHSSSGCERPGLCRGDSCANVRMPCQHKTCCKKSHAKIHSKNAYPTAYQKCAKRQNKQLEKKSYGTLRNYGRTSTSLPQSSRKYRRLKKHQNRSECLKVGLANSSKKECVRNKCAGNFSSPKSKCNFLHCPFCSAKNKHLCKKSSCRRPEHDSLYDYCFNKGSSHLKPSYEPKSDVSECLAASKRSNKYPNPHSRRIDLKTQVPNQHCGPQQCPETSTSTSIPSLDSKTSSLIDGSIRSSRPNGCPAFDQKQCDHKSTYLCERCFNRSDNYRGKGDAVYSEPGSMQCNNGTDCDPFPFVGKNPTRSRTCMDNATQCVINQPADRSSSAHDWSTFVPKPRLPFFRRAAKSKLRHLKWKRLKERARRKRPRYLSLSDCSLINKRSKSKKDKALKMRQKMQALQSCRRKMCRRELRQRRNRAREVAQRIRPKDKKFYCLW